MLFNSIEFIFWFLPLTIFGYAFIRRFYTAHLGIAFISFASILFYLWWDINNLGILVGAILVNYAFGRFMISCGSRSGLWMTGKRAALIAGIVFNIGLLTYYKYANFITAQVGLPITHIALPLGISFFTFQKITYLFDCYLGLLSEAGLVEFSLFVDYFPHAIAGPIVHHRDMMPQFLNPRPPIQEKNVQDGLFFFVIGLAKKVLVADTFAPFATTVFQKANAGPESIHFLDAWQGVLAYTMQIYFDFSGYSDMAVGAALMMGISLPFNFNSPYKSTSIVEFWRRWHMTLSRFLKEYIYFPLGGSKRGAIRHYVNLMAVMLIGGFWHGANWTFLVWGGLHGVYLLINHGWRRLVSAIHLPLYPPASVSKAVYWLITFGAVCLAWVFFRADSMDSALNIVKALVGTNGLVLDDRFQSYLGELSPWLERNIGVRFVPGLVVSLRFALYLALATTCCLALPNTQTLVVYLSTTSYRSRTILACGLGLLAAVTIGELDQPSEFLYFNF